MSPLATESNTDFSKSREEGYITGIVTGTVRMNFPSHSNITQLPHRRISGIFSICSWVR